MKLYILIGYDQNKEEFYSVEPQYLERFGIYNTPEDFEYIKEDYRRYFGIADDVMLMYYIPKNKNEIKNKVYFNREDMQYLNETFNKRTELSEVIKSEKEKKSDVDRVVKLYYKRKLYKTKESE